MKAHLTALLFAGIVMLTAMLASGAARADCVSLSAAAEARYGIPQGILQSIAMAESGIGSLAWPWVLNVSGKSYYFRTREDARKTAEFVLEKIGDNMDIGCMQVNLHWHGRAFVSIDNILDAPTNVDYAARFLVSLRQSQGSWTAAVMRYHSSIPTEQVRYLCRVLQMRESLGYQRGQTCATGW